jgi:putative DNA primase/helicase
VFCATVNREDFLIDETGNTRWWTLPIIEIDFNHDLDMQQLWAQVYHIYKTEKPNWWLSRSEEIQLETLNQSHRATSSIRQLIEARIDFSYKQHWVNCSVVNATTILQSLGKQNPSNTEAKECAAVMREHLGESIRSNGVSGWRVNLPDHG